MAAAAYQVNDDSDSLSSGDKRVGFDFVTEDLSWSPGHDLTWSPGRCERRRRDSGYGTDSSPARMATPRQLHFDRDARGSGMRQLNFDLDTPDFVNDLMNIHKDALKDSSELQGELSATNNLLIDNRTIDYESDDADKEVEDLFMKSCELGNSDSVSQSMNTQRPSAPVPISEECFKAECCVTRDCEWNVDTDYSDLTNSHPCHQTPCYTISHYNRHYFRPICNTTGSDSLGQEYHIASSDFKLLDILRCQQCHKAERKLYCLEIVFHITMKLIYHSPGSVLMSILLSKTALSVCI